MARKHAKEESVDLFYLNNKDKGQSKNIMEKDRAGKSRPKKKKIKIVKKNKVNTTKQKEDDKFNFDNEIVIGVNIIPDSKKNKQPYNQKKEKQKSSKKKQNKAKKNINNLNRKNSTENNINKGNKNNKGYRNKKLTEEQQRKIKKNKKIIKCIMLSTVFIGSIIFFMTTPVFDVSEINVVGNEYISSEKILSLSGINIRRKHIQA